MSFQSRDFHFSIAQSQDGDEILQLFEDMDFTGNFSIMFTRRPDPIESLEREGFKVFIPVAKDNLGKICAMGCCIIRKAYINGEVKNVGYLTGLKIHKDYKNVLRLIREAYSFLYQNTKDDVDIYYTTILEENKGAQKLLEKKRKNMPSYKYEQDYKVYMFANSPLLSYKDEKFKDFTFERGYGEDVEKFYKENLINSNFSPADKIKAMDKDNFFSLRNPKGDIVACLNLWDQRDYKQYIVTDYSGWFKLVSKLPVNMLGYPSFPKVGQSVNYACISLFLVKDMDAEIGEYFLKNVIKQNQGYDLLLLGLIADHPFHQIFHKIKHITYASKLYRVSWDDDFIDLDNRPLNIEVGLL